MKIKNLILFSAFFMLIGCDSKRGMQAISEEEVASQVEYLASDRLAGRQAGSEGAQLAAEYIIHYLQGLGIKPLGKDYRHPFIEEPFNYVRYSAGIHNDEAAAAYVCGNNLCNVMAVIEGEISNEIVLAGAHYDHVGEYPGLMEGDYIFNGADDNASGTVALLQIAKAFATSGKQPKKTLILAFWDGEERNCKGSEHFAKNNPLIKDIHHCINLDMVGRGATDSLACICSEQYREQYLMWVNQAIKKGNLPLKITTDSPYTVYDDSDQRPFAEAGIPCLWFFTGEHPDVHTPYDEASKLDIPKITHTAKAAYYVLWQLCNEESRTR